MGTFSQDCRPAREVVAEQAAKHTLALNPMVGLRSRDLLGAAGTVFKVAIFQPGIAVKQSVSLLADVGKAVVREGTRAVEPGDKRFSDPAWKTSKVHRKLLQSYLAWSDALTGFVDQADLDEHDRARAKLMASMLVDALAPTNALLVNPAALKKIVDSGGDSLWSGLKNYVDDLIKNGGMPSQVDSKPFALGKNIATTAGAVVHRSPVFEVIQYKPLTDEVWRRPVLITPPQINKYYSLDLTPEKSLIRFLLQEGFQVFCISWRNPKPQQRDWGLDAYVKAVDEAVDVARAVSGSPDVSLMGACSGGITASAYAAWQAGLGRSKVSNLVLAVCALDPSTVEDTTLGTLVTPVMIEAAKKASHARGILDGRELAKVFAWMRPNDLIWNYWVNNYLLGNAPPAFDILFWNNDTTALPARLHSDFLDMIETNPFRRAGALSILGTPIDMEKAKVDAYVVSGATDHITPWKSVYQTARILGEKTTFIRSNAGHLQCLLNPPGNPKASYEAGPATSADPDSFAATAEKRTGSWWTHWSAWLSTRSGEKAPAANKLGNEQFRPGEAAPGTYVFNA
jgi:polyhydroxyalkanoate synthase subunit PhaC